MRTMVTTAAVAACLVVAGCGDSEPASTAATPADPSSEAALEAAADAWADGFAEGDPGACRYMAPEGVCSIYLDGTPSSWMRSYGDAEIDGIQIDGEKARVSFTNGDDVVFQLRDGIWKVVNAGGSLAG